MNKLIEDQLKKIQFADLSNFDPIENEYSIPKRVDIKIEKYKSYIIELKKECFDRESIININWNKSKIPNCNFYKAEVIDILPKVIHIEGLGYDIDSDKDLDVFWNGYVPINGIKIIKKL